jgi:hypothetical protein
MHILALVTGAVLAAGAVSAQPAKPWPPDGYSQQQLEAMPEAERNAQPFFNLMTAIAAESGDVFRRFSAFQVSDALRRLYFFHGMPGEALTTEIIEAIAAFQQSLGEPADGVLSYGQAMKLFDRVERVRESEGHIALPLYMVVSVGQDLATARGT